MIRLSIGLVGEGSIYSVDGIEHLIYCILCVLGTMGWDGTESLFEISFNGA
jgi:hypothetical protein